jgi:TonB-linked SusC/RagA family outer membrane protein
MNVVKRLLASMLFLLVTYLALAQTKPISGRILADDGSPLAGVTVRVKGTSRSVQTDASGNYTINAQQGDVIQFSFVGFDLREVKVGSSSTVDARLNRNSTTLEEVTVAMDIKRNPKELGYSVQKVSGAEIAETQRENFMNSLQGRVAGLTINPTTGIAGASTQIVLRGFNSMALDNSPLFIIDGVVADNDALSENHGGGGPGSGMGLASARENRNNDYTNRMADINPNDIESITVLKGPEATALYGSQAAGGAIVITTKKGTNSGRVNFTYDNSFRFSKQTRYPRMQTRYDGGANGVASNIFSYFGPEYQGGIDMFDNDPSVFFQTGKAFTNNLTAEYGKKNYTFRISGSAFKQDGTVPTNTYDRYTVRLTNTTRINKYIDIVPSVTYTSTNNSKPLRGASGYLLNLLAWPADADVRDWRGANGSKKGLYNANPNAELDNPFFNVYGNRSKDRTTRWLGTLGVNVNPFKWLSLAGRFGYDTYRQEGFSYYHPTSFYLTRAQGGSLDNYYRDFAAYNHTATATAKHKIGDFTGRLMVGNMWQESKLEMFAISGTKIIDSVSATGVLMKDGKVLTEADWQALMGSFPDSSLTNGTRLRLNNANRFKDKTPNLREYRQSAYFAEASIGWKNAVFVTYSHRFEEASVFPKDFRSYNYPAGSVSVIVTDLIPGIKGRLLDYLKLRGSRANTARNSAPYANQPSFNLNTGSGGGYYYGFTNANPLLRPEKQNTYEYGTELRLFKGRMNIDATYYNTLNTDLIVELFRASYGTGFVLNTLNVGSNRNRGVEVSVDGTVIQRKNLRWTSRLNFNRMRNEVLSLPPNVPEFYISDTWLYGNARAGLMVGGPTTTITGLGYQRNNAGDILVDPVTGLPLNMPSSALFKILGDRNPDFTLGSLNTVTWKNFRFTMLWDLKVGGDIFNATEMYLTRIGRSLRSEDRMTPRVVKGVLADGLQNTDRPTQNNIAFIPYYNQTYYTSMPEEEFIEKDVNWLRLRDITVNYTFTKDKLRMLRYVKTLSIFVTGNDLFLFTNYTGADPSVNGNTAGTRGVGAFGFDYGNVGTPLSLNFGLRASF